MSTYIADAALSRIRAIAAAAVEPVDPDPEFRQLRRRVRLGEIVLQGPEDRTHRGANLEYLSEMARRSGRPYDHRRPQVGFDLLAERALTVGVGSQGGYLTTTDVPSSVIDILRPWSIVAKAGVSIQTGLRQSAAYPRLSGSVTGYWLSNDLSSITDSGAQTLTQQSVSPHICGASVKYSRQLLLQAPGIEALVAGDLLRTVATLVDQAVIPAGGTAGQPVGLLGTAGIATQSLASFTWSTSTTMKTTLATANVVDDGTTAFIMNPTVKGALEARDRGGATATGRYIVQGEKSADLPTYASTVMPSNTVVCGRWSDVLVATWGDGLELEATPFALSSDFQQGLIACRVLLTCDVVTRHPTAFVAGSNFS